MPEAALNNWQPVWNAQVSISTPVCVNIELRPGAGDIHICWFNFDALAQGNAYKWTDKLSWTRRGSNSWSPDWGNSASSQLSSTIASRHWNCVKKHNSSDMREEPKNYRGPGGDRAHDPQIDETLTYIHACMHTYIHTYIIHTYIFVVNFDPLAQASDIQIERRQVVFLCWRQDLNPGPQTPNRQQTECSLTNRLSYRGSS